MLILVVDDSKVMRMIVKRTLRQAGFGGHTVVEAENGVEALDRIGEKKPDLVLLDWDMPEMNGLDLLRAVRAEDKTLRMGFVTARATAEMRDIARSAGANFFIAKPFNAEIFDEVLARFLR